MKRAKKQRAFSLIEVLLALGIVAIAFIPLVGMIPMILNTSTASVDETKAIHLISAVIQDLRYTPATESQSRLFHLSPLPTKNSPLNTDFKVWVDSSWNVYPESKKPARFDFELEWKYTALSNETETAPIEGLITVRWPPKMVQLKDGKVKKQSGGELSTAVAFPMP